MAKDQKRLCKWDSDQIEKKMKKYQKLVLPPHYLCAKCGRVAADAESLCKAIRIEK